MMRKLPRVPCLVVLHVLFFILIYLFLFDDIKNQSPSFQHKAQVSALIESMHEPWDVAFTSNLSGMIGNGSGGGLFEPMCTTIGMAAHLDDRKPEQHS